MKKIAVFLVFCSLLTSGLFGEEGGQIKDFSGKVEVKMPGGAWQPAAKGTKVDPGTQISTGFNSGLGLRWSWQIPKFRSSLSPG